MQTVNKSYVANRSAGSQPAGRTLSEYAQLVALLPLFKATKLRSKHTRSCDNPEIFETSWGPIKRWGPGLNVYDEETLLALAHLSPSKLDTPSQEMVGQLRMTTSHLTDDETPYPPLDELWPGRPICVQSGGTTIVQICQLLGDTPHVSRMRRESMNRLCNTRFVHRIAKDIRLQQPESFGPMLQVSKNGELLHDIEWSQGFFDYKGRPDFQGRFEIDWTPMYSEVSSAYRVIDYEVYRGLKGNYAKLIYKLFVWVMASQRRFTIGFQRLSRHIGFSLANKDYREIMRIVTHSAEQINELQSQFTLHVDYTPRGGEPRIIASCL